MRVAFRRFGEHGFLPPAPSTPQAAGLDLRNAGGDFELWANQQELVRTGFGVAIPEGHVGLIAPRSGLAKLGVSVHAGVIDPDFRGEIGVILRRGDGFANVRFAHGDRIAQLLIVPCPSVQLEEIDAETWGRMATARGAGGFGSTGSK